MIVEPLVGETMDANCAKADAAREAMTRKVFILGWSFLVTSFAFASLLQLPSLNQHLYCRETLRNGIFRPSMTHCSRQEKA